MLLFALIPANNETVMEEIERLDRRTKVQVSCLLQYDACDILNWVVSPLEDPAEGGVWRKATRIRIRSLPPH